MRASSPEVPILEGRFCLCCYFGQRMDHWGLSRLAPPADMGKQNLWGGSSSYSCVWRCHMLCYLLLEPAAMLWGGQSSWAGKTLWSSNGTLCRPIQLWVRSHDNSELDSHGVCPLESRFPAPNHSITAGPHKHWTKPPNDWCYFRQLCFGGGDYYTGMDNW